MQHHAITNAILHGTPYAKPRRGSLLCIRSAVYRNCVFGLCVVAFACALECGASVDFDFESAGAGWNLPQPNFSVRAGAGRNGTSALVCEGKDTNAYQIAFCDLPFKTGQDLEVTVWIRNESLSKGEPGACMEYFGRNGATYEGGVGFALAPGQPDDPKAWRKYVARTHALSPRVWHCRVRLYIGTGVEGRCCFDDVSYEVKGSREVGTVFSSASDDRAVSGKVRFSATTYADLRDRDPATLEAFFTVEGTNGVERLEPDCFSNGLAEVSVDVARLALGTHRVVFSLKEKGGLALDELKLGFTRLERPQPAKTCFDEHRRLVVDGKPTYPILMYTHEGVIHDPRFLPAVKSGPISNFVYYTENPSRADLDFFAANGLRVFDSLIYTWSDGYHPAKEIGNWDEENAYVVRKVNELRDHPALLGWYLFDEPEPDRLPRTRERYKIVKALDPERAALVVLNHGENAERARGTCDVLGLDCYPIPSTGTEETNPADLGRVSRQVRTALGGTRGEKPLWLVPQAFCADANGGRFPSLRELRSMVWQGIARGADGVLFYSMEQMLWKKHPDFSFERAWEIVRTVAEEIRSHEDMLISTEPAPVPAEVPDGVVARAWYRDGGLLLVLVNTTHEPVEGSLKLCGRPVSFALGADGVIFKSKKSEKRRPAK